MDHTKDFSFTLDDDQVDHLWNVHHTIPSSASILRQTLKDSELAFEEREMNTNVLDQCVPCALPISPNVGSGVQVMNKNMDLDSGNGQCWTWTNRREQEEHEQGEEEEECDPIVYQRRGRDRNRSPPLASKHIRKQYRSQQKRDIAHMMLERFRNVASSDRLREICSEIERASGDKETETFERELDAMALHPSLQHRSHFSAIKPGTPVDELSAKVSSNNQQN
jgi:hypothetical protein